MDAADEFKNWAARAKPTDYKSLALLDVIARVERMEETLQELLEEPGNTYLGYEMARSRLRRPLSR